MFMQVIMPNEILYQGDHEVTEKIPNFQGFFQSDKLYFSTGYRKKK